MTDYDRTDLQDQLDALEATFDVPDRPSLFLFEDPDTGEYRTPDGEVVDGAESDALFVLPGTPEDYDPEADDPGGGEDPGLQTTRDDE